MFSLGRIWYSPGAVTQKRNRRDGSSTIAVLHHNLHGNLKAQFHAVYHEGQYKTELICI